VLARIFPLNIDKQIENNKVGDERKTVTCGLPFASPSGKHIISTRFLARVTTFCSGLHLLPTWQH